MSNLIKNSAVYLVATILLKATNFLLLPLYSSIITPDTYGHVYIITSFTSFFSIFLALSMNGAIQRYFFNCKSEDDVKKMYSTIVYFVLGVALCVSLLLFVIASPLSEWLKIPTLYLNIAIITVFLSVFYNLIIALLYVKQKAVKISLVTIVTGVIQIVAQLVLVLNMNDKALAIVLSILLSGIFQFIIFAIFSRQYIVLKFDRRGLYDYLVYGFSQLPSDISTWVVSFIDRIILNRYQNTAAVGIYGMGNTMASIPSVLFQSMNKALSPIVFEDYKKNELTEVDSLNYSSVMIEKIFVLITMLVSGLLVFSNDIISIFLAKTYSDSAIVMFLVMIACLVDIYRMLFMYPMTYNVKYVKVKSIIWIFASAASIGLNFLLIPHFSYLGACYTLIIVNTITLSLILFFSQKAMNPNYNWKKLLFVFLVSAIYSCCFFIGNSWMGFALKSLLTIVYLSLLYKIYPIDLKYILSFINKKK